VKSARRSDGYEDGIGRRRSSQGSTAQRGGKSRRRIQRFSATGRLHKKMKEIVLKRLPMGFPSVEIRLDLSAIWRVDYRAVQKNGQNYWRILVKQVPHPKLNALLSRADSR